MPLWGSNESFNLNPMLLNQISSCPYFLKCCNELHDWNEIVDEIYYEVKHVEPWAAGPGSKVPSSAFCLMLRLLTLRCSEKQMQLLLDHPDSPYIRCIGFLYLRYVCPPQLIWGWIKPYVMEDSDQFAVTRSGKGGNKNEMTMGQYVRFLFDSSCEYYGTRLPRIESGTARELQVQLLRASKLEERAQNHWASRVKMDYFTTVGNRVRALYEDADNPSTWYDAVIDRVLEAKDSKSRKPQFIVTFPAYGNTETVTLGEVDMPNEHVETNQNSDPSINRRARASYPPHGQERRLNEDSSAWRGESNWKDRGRRYRDDDPGYENRRPSDRGYRKHHASDQNQRYRQEEENDLMNEVLQRERDRTTTVQKRSYYSSRQGYKESPSTNYIDDKDHRKDLRAKPSRSHCGNSRDDGRRNDPDPKKRTPQDLAAVVEKKRKLLSRYG